MNPLEKYAAKRKLAMGLSNMLMGLAGKLGGHRPMGHSPLGGSFPLGGRPSHGGPPSPPPQPSPCGAHSMMPRDDDAKMLSKMLDSTAAQAISLKKKIDMGHKLPSWAEYKVYKAADSMKSATASTFSLRPKITVIIKRAVAEKNRQMRKEAAWPLIAAGLGLGGLAGYALGRNPYKKGTIKHKMYGASGSGSGPAAAPAADPTGALNRTERATKGVMPYRPISPRAATR